MSVRNELICVPFAPAGINAFSTKRFDVRLQALGEFRFVARALWSPGYLRENQGGDQKQDVYSRGLKRNQL